MKALLDENLPVKLKYRFSSAVSVLTVNDMKWNSLKNGELLKALEDNDFDVLITSDKNMIHQHKLSKFSFRFMVLNVYDNQYDTILPLVPIIEQNILRGTEQVVHIKG
jgi:predicted nuclease of predicted toxin-antitoxin system